MGGNRRALPRLQFCRLPAATGGFAWPRCSASHGRDYKHGHYELHLHTSCTSPQAHWHFEAGGTKLSRGQQRETLPLSYRSTSAHDPDTYLGTDPMGGFFILKTYFAAPVLQFLGTAYSYWTCRISATPPGLLSTRGPGPQFTHTPHWRLFREVNTAFAFY